MGATLNDLVTVSNPLDYHTFIWGDADRLAATFTAMLGCGFDLALLVIDPPRTDRCDDAEWHVTFDAFEDALRRTGARGCVLATLPESFPETLAEDLLARGSPPSPESRRGSRPSRRRPTSARRGRRTASRPGSSPESRLGDRARSRAASRRETVLSEREAKELLAHAGIPVPPGELVRSPDEAVAAAARVGAPVAVKAVGRGLSHKSEKGAVRLALEAPAEIEAAARVLLPHGDSLLVERMVGDGVAEVVVGVSRDPQVGLVLVVGSGGLLVELAGDRVVLLAPASRGEIEAALSELKVAALVDGFRGRPAGDRAALVDTVLAVQRFALDRADRLIELDLNPLIVRPAGRGVAAVDAVLRIAPEDPPEDPAGDSTGDPT